MTHAVTLIESADFRYTADIQAIDLSPGSYCMQIRSRWSHARRADEEQVRFSACVDRQGLSNLARLIEQALELEQKAQPAQAPTQAPAQAPAQAQE